MGIPPATLCSSLSGLVAGSLRLATKLPSCAKRCYVARMNGRCLVCDADDEVRAAVEQLLLKGTPLRKIQRLSGFDKSLLSRHNSHLVHPTLARNRDNKLLRRTQRIITRWWNGSLFIQQSAGHDTNAEPVTITQSQLKPSDVIVKISLTASAIRNPAALEMGARFLSALAAETNPKPVETTQDGAEPSFPVEEEKIVLEPIVRQESQSETPVQPQNDRQHAGKS